MDPNEHTDKWIEDALATAVQRAAADAQKAPSLPLPALRGTRHYDMSVPAFKASTAALYFRQAKALAAKCGYGDSPASIALMLLNTPVSIELLQFNSTRGWSTSTQVSHVSRVLGMIKQCELAAKLAHEQVEAWRELLRTLTMQNNAKENTDRRTAKLVANWVSIKDQVNAKFEELEADPSKKASQHALLLGMCALMKPLRGGDAGTLQIKFGPQDSRHVRDEHGRLTNFIVLHCPTLAEDAQSAHISLGQYKVARSHGALHIPVPQRLVKVIQASLRLEPREFLFSDRSGKPRTREAHSDWANDVLSRHLGSKVTTTLLRHVSATEIDWNDVDMHDLEQHAADMATSTSMLLKHYRVPGVARKRTKKA